MNSVSQKGEVFKNPKKTLCFFFPTKITPASENPESHRPPLTRRHCVVLWSISWPPPRMKLVSFLLCSYNFSQPFLNNSMWFWIRVRFRFKVELRPTKLTSPINVPILGVGRVGEASTESRFTRRKWRMEAVFRSSRQ